MQMSRRRKWIIGLLVLGSVLLAVGYFVALPRIVRWQVAKRLNDAGLPATFDVSSAGFFSSDIANLKASDDAVMKQLTIEYSVIGLAQGRINGLRISGLSLLVDFQHGRADLGVIDQLLARRNTGTTQPTTREIAPAEPLPLDRITLTDSVIIARTPQQELRLPVAGTLTVKADGALVLDADVKATGSNIHVGGTIDSASGRIDLRATSTSLDVPALLSVAKALLPAVNAQMTGTAAADVRYVVDGQNNSISIRLEPENLIARIPQAKEKVTKLQVQGGVLLVDAVWTANTAPTSRPSVKVVATGLSIANEDNDAHLDGLTAALAYGPGMEAEVQSITIDRAQVGKMQVSSGMAKFTIDQQHNVVIEKTNWAWLGGMLSAANISIKPGQPTDLTIDGRGIELKPLLEAFGSGKISGEGKIDLNVPLRIDWPRLGFGRGSVKNIGAGRLQIADAAKVADTVAGQAGNNPGEQEKLKRDVIESLKDLDFEVLTLDLRPDKGSLMADAHLTGRGREGARKAVDLEVHLSQVDDLIEFYLGVAGRLSGQ